MTGDWTTSNDPDWPEWPVYRLSVEYDETIQGDAVQANTRLGGRKLYGRHALRDPDDFDAIADKVVEGMNRTVREFTQAGYSPSIFSEKERVAMI